MGIDHGEAGAPFEVADQGGAEFWIGGDAVLIGGFEEEVYPAFPLLIVEHFADVVADHHGVAAAIYFSIFFGAAEDFRDEMRHVTGMVGAHVAKNGAKQFVLQDFVVETPEKGLEGVFAAGPVIKCRSRFHAIIGG